MTVLHVVARPVAGGPLALARDLANEPWTAAGSRQRVLELFDPRANQVAVDLTLGERDLPEVCAVMHEVTEIHLHRVHPKLALRWLPDVRQAVLSGISLVVHGPVARSANEAPELAPLWPGPIVVDGAAAELDPTAVRVATRVFVDLDAADLLPRACGAVPQDLGDDEWLAVVCLGESLSDAVRAQLRIELAALSRPGLRIEVHDEGEIPREERAVRRRAACAYVTAAGGDTPSRELVEAVAQAVPVIVIGTSPGGPAGAVIHVADRDPVDRTIALVRSWMPLWSSGEAPASDANARGEWLERVCGSSTASE